MNIGVVLIVTLVWAFVPSSVAQGYGEGVLALTGQYTFFVKPYPGQPITHYQKVVPCVSRKSLQNLRPHYTTVHVPYGARRKQPIIVVETPLSMGHGPDPSITCLPKPRQHSMWTDVEVPRTRPTRVRILAPSSSMVSRRIVMPYWFEVREELRPSPVLKTPSVGH